MGSPADAGAGQSGLGGGGCERVRDEDGFGESDGVADAAVGVARWDLRGARDDAAGADGGQCGIPLLPAVATPTATGQGRQ